MGTRKTERELLIERVAARILPRRLDDTTMEAAKLRVGDVLDALQAEGVALIFGDTLPQRPTLRASLGDIIGRARRTS